ncbi:MAG: hypothetical protein IJ293_02255, partial [Treponema sp.]|nr:hypothetical protein [Treponema sp.]
DQQEIQQKEAENARVPSEFGIILSDEEKLLSRLVKFNTQNGEIIKSSPVSVIRNRTIYENGENYIAIAGETEGNATVKLVLIDNVNMEIVKESQETIAQDSVLVKDGEDYYCVINNEEKYYLGKFNSDLELKLKSEVEIKSSSPVTITESGIVVTDISGTLRLLDKKDLSSITKVVDAK